MPCAQNRSLRFAIHGWLVNNGYEALELKAGDENPELDIERVREVRKAIARIMTIQNEKATEASEKT